MDEKSTFSEATRLQVEGAVNGIYGDLLRQFYGTYRHYTSKQRNRIFRRRPREFREKWRRVYAKLQAHERKKSLRGLEFRGVVSRWLG